MTDHRTRKRRQVGREVGQRDMAIGHSKDDARDDGPRGKSDHVTLVGDQDDDQDNLRQFVQFDRSDLVPQPLLEHVQAQEQN